MKKVILVLGSALFLIGCAADESKQADQTTPRFGKPESAIPWNQPTDWEKNGSLGAMPGFDQSH
jgi:hypothetical protein